MITITTKTGMKARAKLENGIVWIGLPVIVILKVDL